MAAAGPVEVNNHVHTTYSFSPYTPAQAAEKAAASGLAAVGIMDHDSVAGAAEMHEAGRRLGIATTAGVEVRVDAAGTAVAGRMINNPDSPGILYMMLHGIPARRIAEVSAFLRPIQASRERRTRRMAEQLNGLLPDLGLPAIDFRADVRGISRADAGGTITERHLLFAMAGRILAAAGRGPALVAYLRDRLRLDPPARLSALLADPANPFLAYDLLGVLKSRFLGRIFIQPDAEECVPVAGVVRLAARVGAIPCYAYLGDVGESPTGDKKAERFEDSWLDELVVEVKRLGFRAVAYMPPRNTREQLRRVRRLCAEHGLMEISGVDINSPRQSFKCPEVLLPEFVHLVDATWALIAHEKLQACGDRFGLFHPDNPLADRPLAERIAAYASIGRRIDAHNPGRVDGLLPD
jgi:predicted metal-dependent phosphoesterase TrpH